ncbi:MAG: hypothetical protein ACK5HR_06695 [Mycoplasmatales bacterium]
MRINIPQKLIKYKEHIKTSTFKVIYSQRFSFLKIGSTAKNDTFRELYLCYNPYDVDVKFDINYFKSDKNIYKLYPPNVNVKSGEVFAFMVFSTQKSTLEFDIDILMYNKKNKINNLINEINKKNNIIDLDLVVEEYDEEINSTIILDNLEQEEKSSINNLDIEATQYLGKSIPNFPKEGQVIYEKYKLTYNDIKVKLEEISYKKNKYIFILNVINTNLNKNYKINGMNLKILDKKLKKLINIKMEIKMKKYSMKQVSFAISENELKNFMISDIKIDVVVY